VIAIDGKTVRRSGRKSGGKAAIHMVSAFAPRQRLVLGQVKVAEKSNEIIAIPKLLEMMAIEGAIITIDAMGKAGPRFRQAKPDGMARRGCQRDIAQKVIDKKADYVLALKGNQAHCARTSNSSLPNRKPKALQTPRSVRIRRSMATTVASKPERPPSCTMSAGFSSATHGPV
jgi:predicted transposase YbfD/YdcC